MTLFNNPENISCPKCETPNPLEIIYGRPSNEMQHAELEGVITMGDAAIDGAGPAYQCRDCGERFGTV